MFKSELINYSPLEMIVEKIKTIVTEARAQI